MQIKSTRQIVDIYRDYTAIPDTVRNSVVAMGNFDGVHLGHLSVLTLAKAAAVAEDAKLGTITFEPHPRQLFSPDAPDFRLMNAEARANRLEKLGIDYLFELNFDQALSQLSAEEFVTKVLVAGLGIKHVVIGADFRFGQKRQGNADTLVKLGETHGFGVTVAPLVSDEKGDYSSTAIRTALSEGRPEDAARILGHWHRVDGIVVQGDQRGRELGFPTANVYMDGLHLPKFGVYAVLFEILDGPFQGMYKGAASMGVRPTFGINHPNLETYLFDFTGDLYGARVSVAFIEYLRPEEKYDDLDALIQQMKADCFEAREILAKVM